MDYEKLREKYPETITMEQFYQIAHISKRKASWLLTNGIVPCEDSGKQTRRFKICLDDVICFLQHRDAGEFETVIPGGTFSSVSPKELPVLDIELLTDFLLTSWQEAPDMLTAKQAAELTGYVTTSINRWAQCAKVKSVHYRGVNLIAKESLAEYLASPEGQRISVKSELHRMAMEEMSEEQNSGMELTMSL